MKCQTDENGRVINGRTHDGVVEHIVETENARVQMKIRAYDGSLILLDIGNILKSAICLQPGDIVSEIFLYSPSILEGLHPGLWNEILCGFQRTDTSATRRSLTQLIPSTGGIFYQIGRAHV